MLVKDSGNLQGNGNVKFNVGLKDRQRFRGEGNIGRPDS